MEQFIYKKNINKRWTMYDFPWRVKIVPNWLGGTEVMIELEGVDGCIAFGCSFRDAKVELSRSFSLWLQTHGEHRLPPRRRGAHLIRIEAPMSAQEVQYINNELKKLDS